MSRDGSRDAVHEQALYRARAAWYDAIYHWKGYAGDALRVRTLLHDAGVDDGSSVLEAACGTGSYLRTLRAWFRVSGFDLNAEMLAIARTKVPGVHLFEADMARFTVDAPVDALLCLFSSIGYVHPRARLDAAAACFAAAVRPGGVLIVEPWIDPDAFIDGDPHMETYDAPDRKLARVCVSRREGDLAIIDFHWLAAARGRTVEHVTDRHVAWLCPRADMLAAFDTAGFECRVEPDGLMPGRGLIIGRRR